MRPARNLGAVARAILARAAPLERGRARLGDFATIETGSADFETEFCKIRLENSQFGLSLRNKRLAPISASFRKGVIYRRRARVKTFETESATAIPICRSTKRFRSQPERLPDRPTGPEAALPRSGLFLRQSAGLRASQSVACS